MRSGALALAASLLLAACASTPPPAPVRCTALDFQPTEAPPVAPDLTASQRLAVYQAVLGALPVGLAQAWFRFHEVEVLGHARRLRERVDAQTELCAKSEL